MIPLAPMPEEAPPVTLCTNCSENPAEPGSGTVPLCAKCKGLATGKERGVVRKPKAAQVEE